jgi:hypothetical protein
VNVILYSGSVCALIVVLETSSSSISYVTPFADHEDVSEAALVALDAGEWSVSLPVSIG